MILEIQDPLPLTVDGKGSGLAKFLIDYGPENDLLWVVLMDNGEIWCAPNPKVRLRSNWTMGRSYTPSSVMSSSVKVPVENV